MITEHLVDMILLAFLVIIALAALRLRDLFAVAMLFAIYSLVCASLFLVMDAVDVAFTEAAVGVGIATVLMLGTLSLTNRYEKESAHRSVIPLLTVMITGLALVYGTLDMPLYGDPEAPVHQHVAPRYLHASQHEVGIPNIVTAVLASYRGFDTLGEIVVIFTAGVGVLILLGGAGQGSGKDGEDR